MALARWRKLDFKPKNPEIHGASLFSVLGNRGYVKVKSSNRGKSRQAEGMSPKNLTIIGPGALGILFATRIWQVFPHVSLLHHDGVKAQRMATGGVAVLEEEGTVLRAFPRVSANAREIGRQDVIIVLVKAFQTEQILPDLEALCTPDTLVVTLQNGIGTGDILAKVAPAENLVLGVTMHGANKKDETTVVHAGEGETILGMFERDAPPSKKLKGLADLLEKGGFAISLVEDIYPVLWKKLMVNVGINPLTVLSGLRNGQILEHPELAAIQEMAVLEAFNVMKAHGIDIGMNFKEVLGLVRKVCRDTSRNVSSMLQDRINRRQTEIEFINGAVVRLAHEAGLDAPVNESLYCWVRFFTRRGWDFGTC